MAKSPGATAPNKATVEKTVGTKPPAPKLAIRPAQFRIESVERKERNLKMLIYGNYGVGKTTLACSALDVPSMRDVLIINAESGDLSVDHMDNLDAVTVTDFKTLGRINEYLRRHCKARDDGNEEFLIESEANLRGVEEAVIKKRGPRKYRTVILDSLTELEAYCFNQLLGITDSTRIDEEVQSAEWTEYKKNNAMILRVVRAFRDLPMHVIFTCAEKYNQDESKKYKYSPDMTGKLTKKVQGFMDMVGYYVMGVGSEGNEQRKLFVSPSASGRYDAKHRFQQFKGNSFTDPTLGSILKAVGLLDTDGATLK